MPSLADELWGGGADEAAEASPLDEMFDSYYRPLLDDEDDEGDTSGVAPYIEAVEAENAEVLAELETADNSHRMKRTSEAVGSGVDADYFFCVVFVSEEQKRQFLAATKWDEHGGERFINGVLLAKAMGVSLDPAYLATSSAPDRRLVEYEQERAKDHGSSSN